MPEDEQSKQVSSNKLRRLAKSRKYDELESAWLAAIEQDPIDIEGMLEALAVPARRGDTDAEVAESLLWTLVEGMAERSGDAEALGIVHRAAPLFPDSRPVRKQTAELYRKVHASQPSLDALLDMTILCRTTPFPDAMRQAEALRALAPGTYVWQRNRPGRVIGLDAEEQMLGVAFPDEEVKLAASAASDLQVLGPGDFRARVMFETEQLKELAKEDPERLLIRVLEAFGPRLTYRDLKQHLERVIPPSSWSRWWSKTRPKIKHSPSIDMTGSSQPKFFLRAEPLSYGEEARMRFNGAGSLVEKLSCVLGYLAEIRKGLEPDTEVAGHFAAKLAESAAKFGPESLESTGPLAVIAELRSAFPDVATEAPFSLADIVSRAEDASPLLDGVQNDSVALCVLSRVREVMPEKWPEVYAQAMPSAATTVCDWISTELLAHKHGESLAPAAERIVKHPDASAAAMMWLWKALGTDEAKKALEGVNPLRVAAAMLRGCEQLKRSEAPDARSLMNQIPKALAAKDYEVLRAAMKDGDPEDADDIRRITQHHVVLTDYSRDEITRIIRMAHPSLFEEHVPPWEESTLYTTAEGLTKRQKEYTHLVNVELVEIGKEIGDAASLGDLSENAEFTAALEQRDRLSKRAETMKEELAKARVITKDMAQGNEVTVGSGVKARDTETGDTETFVFLGPWDVDPDKGVYSYSAPLGLAFMGKTTGDTIEVKTDSGERRWEILEVFPGV